MSYVLSTNPYYWVSCNLRLSGQYLSHSTSSKQLVPKCLGYLDVLRDLLNGFFRLVQAAANVSLFRCARNLLDRLQIFPVVY